MTQPQANQDSNNRANRKYSFTESYNRKPIHYDFTIEPFDYIHDNDMGFAEGNIVKYITRWKYKDGLQDLYKAKRYIEMLIEKEEQDGEA